MHRKTIWKSQRCDEFCCLKRAESNAFGFQDTFVEFRERNFRKIHSKNFDELGCKSFTCLENFHPNFRVVCSHKNPLLDVWSRLKFSKSRLCSRRDFSLFLFVLRFSEPESALFIHFRIVSCFMTGRLGTKHWLAAQFNLKMLRDFFSLRFHVRVFDSGTYLLSAVVVDSFFVTDLPTFSRLKICFWKGQELHSWRVCCCLREVKNLPIELESSNWNLTVFNQLCRIL